MSTDRSGSRNNWNLRVIAAAVSFLFIATQAGAVSLWDDKNGGLFSARRTFKTGDILSIQITEQTSATQDWKQERDKEIDISASTDAIGEGAGNKNLLGRFLPFMGGQYKAELKAENEADRRTNVSARVAAEIVSVFPNGNLQIIARKVIRVNSEEQLIELTGIVRPEDVSPANLVASNAIADAEIKVNGTWRYSNDKDPSVLERFVSWLTGIFF